MRILVLGDRRRERDRDDEVKYNEFVGIKPPSRCRQVFFVVAQSQYFDISIFSLGTVVLDTKRPSRVVVAEISLSIITRAAIVSMSHVRVR